MSKSLFVSGLDYSITSQGLQDLFSQHGNVEAAKVVMDRETGRSRGFGFVDLATEEEAQQCINALNGSSQKGRQIGVRVKIERTAQDRRYQNSNW